MRYVWQEGKLRLRVRQSARSGDRVHGSELEDSAAFPLTRVRSPKPTVPSVLVSGQEGWRRGHEGAGKTLEIPKLVLPSSNPGRRQARLPGKRPRPSPWPRPSLQPESRPPHAPLLSAFMASPDNSLGILFLTPRAGGQLFLTGLWPVLWSAVNVSVALTPPPL